LFENCPMLISTNLFFRLIEMIIADV